MDEKLRSLAESPLADPLKIYLPEGKRKAVRGPRAKYHCDAVPGLSGAQVAERKKVAQNKKLTALYDYYAGTDLSVERIAAHMGIYCQKQTGTDEKGKPVFERVLDTRTVEAQIAWRRKVRAA